MNARDLVVGRPGGGFHTAFSAAAFERLEPRRLLHGGHGHDGGGDGDGGEDHLDPAIVAEVRRMVLAGEDVAHWLGTKYDPHAIGVPLDDEVTIYPLPDGYRSASLVLPDMIPWAGNSNQYFHNISFDTFTMPGRRLMRFSTAIANAGDGPVELLAGAANPDGTQQVWQRLYNFNPATAQFTVAGDRLAGNFLYHAAHNHLHFEGYAEYQLLQNVGGQPGGFAFRNDGTPVEGEKVGFCLINVTTYNSSHPGYATSPSGYGCGNRQGISVGRADVYSSGLDAQWIDVTGVAAGQYFMRVILDAGDAVLESNDGNNVITIAVNIPPAGGGGGGVQPDRFDLPTPNNTFETATDFGELGSITETSMTLHATYDIDFYKFVATSSGPINIQLPISGGGNPDLYFYDGDRNEIARSTRPSGTETISTNVVSGETYYIKVNLFQSTSTLVADYALLISGPGPTVKSTLQKSTIREGESTTFTIHRNGNHLQPLNVALEFGGTATLGSDYTVSSTTASFGVHDSQVTLTITALNDRFLEGIETVLIGMAGSTAYAVGSSPMNLYILDASPKRPSIMPERSYDGSTTGLFPTRDNDRLSFSSTRLFEGDPLDDEVAGSALFARN